MFLVILWCKTSFLGFQIEHFETPKKEFYKVKSIKKGKKFSRKRKSWFVFVFFIHIFKRHKFFDKKHKVKGTTKKPKTGRVLRTRRACMSTDDFLSFFKIFKTCWKSRCTAGRFCQNANFLCVCRSKNEKYDYYALRTIVFANSIGFTTPSNIIHQKIPSKRSRFCNSRLGIKRSIKKDIKF